MSYPFRVLSFCFGVKGKTPGLISRKNFVKNICIDHRDNVLARCVSIFPLLRCQGFSNKMCTQICSSLFLFQNQKNYSVGDVQRFCYYSLCDSMVIFDQISNNSNVYLSLSRFWTANSLIIYQLLSVTNFENTILKILNVSETYSREPFTPKLVFLCR
jgi:hypothetical protein